ncbi:hypothetical protein Intca_2391 [Intrasporangium calvum DSM 43043]|uniref:DUF304 domain-containing protein n=2 Tax=Intrasporangium calvum TaxID=53358 RepID=E6SFW9_INTC7|nr:hypothetical protein Intca_2391 [Intrasporangium calvum DSM 43043]AXG13876.1 hypothetical protein DN585_11100 [Intrasporangium calvum]
MIGPMRQPNRTLRAPSPHRAVAALASPVIGYFVARLLLELFVLPELPVYVACLAVAVVLGYRAWTARIDLRDDSLRVHNTLVSTTVAREHVRRVAENGRIEWQAGRSRATRSPAETLRAPWWTVRTGASTYARNREELRSWVRTASRRHPDDEAAA